MLAIQKFELASKVTPGQNNP